MFVWGYETKSANVAAHVSDRCPRCQGVTSHTIRVDWEIVHLYVYARQVRWERWFATCVSCGTEHEMEHAAIEMAKRLPTADPIPLFDRYGGAMVFGAIVAFFALLSWLGADA